MRRRWSFGNLFRAWEAPRENDFVFPFVIRLLAFRANGEMTFPISHHARTGLVAGLLLLGGGWVAAQTDNLSTPGATARASALVPPPDANLGTNIPVAQPATDAALASATNGAAAVPVVAPAAIVPVVSPVSSAPSRPPIPRMVEDISVQEGWWGPVLALAAVGGFIAYYCGLTRAKNCGHTCTVLLAGAMFGLTGFWISGFAVQSGGLGDAHAALTLHFNPLAVGGLDHELGLMLGGHHWGLMGSAAFFLSTDAESRNATALLFFLQAVPLALAVTIALGGVLERVRLLALAISSFLVGALIYPLLANWVWGGGWLAEMGREFGLGHGLVDLAGAGVIHLAAGTLALVFTLELGPRYGRFGRDRTATPIPGHNLPFVILGSAAILLGLTSIAILASSAGMADGGSAGLSATNTLLGAAGGLVASFFFSLHRQRRADPVMLCRGLIGGAVAVSAESALVEAWAAFLTGIIAAGLIEATTRLLERRRIDDPVGVVAVHGAGGAWGLLALGLFADGSAGGGINGVANPVRGLFSHGGGQLVAQFLGCAVIFGVVFGLGWICVTLTQKIVGIRVDVADETAGLDLLKLGLLGYQADAEVEKER
jgi:Amt family ammonium transporter